MKDSTVVILSVSIAVICVSLLMGILFWATIEQQNNKTEIQTKAMCDKYDYKFLKNGISSYCYIDDRGVRIKYVLNPACSFDYPDECYLIVEK